jgi:dTDP-4-amino-4,6-dideoxygalactose transaminase
LIHYPVPPHLQNAYQQLKKNHVSLPIAECYANEVLSLPIGPHLLNQDVAKVIKELTSLGPYLT